MRSERSFTLDSARGSGMIYSHHNATRRYDYLVKKTISLPADLARDTEALARAEGKTLSAVIQNALRQARIERRLQGCFTIRELLCA